MAGRIISSRLDVSLRHSGMLQGLVDIAREESVRPTCSPKAVLQMALRAVLLSGQIRRFHPGKRTEGLDSPSIEVCRHGRNTGRGHRAASFFGRSAGNALRRRLEGLRYAGSLETAARPA